MVGQTDIKQALAQFQTGNSSVLTLAFVDLSSCMVLAASAKKQQPQEYLDELAEEAARMFQGAAANLLNTKLFGSSGLNESWQSDGRGTRLYLRSKDSDEALVFVVSRGVDRSAFVSMARRLGQQVWMS
jgi:hypothetical protein